MRHLFWTTSLARLFLLALVLGLAVALVPGCAGTKCHWEFRGEAGCGSPSDRHPNDPKSPCYGQISAVLVCDDDDDDSEKPKGPENPKTNAWQLPSTLEWVRTLSWEFLDGELHIDPEDVRIRLDSNVSLSSLQDSSLELSIQDARGNMIHVEGLPLRVLGVEGHSVVLVPEEGRSFDRVMRRLAEALADDPAGVVLNEWRVRFPLAEAEVINDDVSPVQANAGSISILGWSL